ncbi:MAG: methionine--tRNA ligase [Proteobacteria bacterium]|nr:methionine--tRNA ligase [Pseudomonadota bacterium]
MPNKVLVTAALPYANGSIHLGHMLEAIQTDIYVRARKLTGDDVIFMWADDTHGTPIQLRAREEGITPEQLVARAHAEHMADYRDFGIGFDIFYTTHSAETEHHAGAIYRTMEARGDIVVRDIENLFCPQDQMFLPDRFVRGQCPRCKSEDQYGDSCEVCGSTYDPTELESPKCSICGATPVMESSEHLFVPLSRHESFLREWLSSERNRLEPAVRNYVMSWVEQGLRDWDISRDGPYFGFNIPGHPGKYFYVWFDAPIGYIAATQKWCDDNDVDFDQYWKNPRGNTEIVHVIGKDIVYFHCLFWPAMLHAAGYTTPSRVNVHGWVTVNGEKMSKSRGTYILARTYLDHVAPDYLRYYFAAKLDASQNDIDLGMEDFANRVNADLVKKAANLASRCAKFVSSRLDGRLGPLPPDADRLIERAEDRLAEAAKLYQRFEFSRATRLAMEIAEDFNQYLTEAAPWKAIKKDPEHARAVCSACLHASKIVAAILKPVLPEWAQKTERFLDLPAPLDFANGGDRLPEGHVIGAYEMLAQPLEGQLLDRIIEASKQGLETKEPTKPPYEVPELAAETRIEDFAKIDLRVGKVIECKPVDGADKLLSLRIDLGPLGQRHILSGIARSYAPDKLVGKHVAVYANLKPRKMRFGVSEGMILAAGEKNDAITVVELSPDSQPGDRIS